MRTAKPLYPSFCLLLFTYMIISCGKQVYSSTSESDNQSSKNLTGKAISNGESIYRTGKNLKGEKMIDRSRSSIPFFNSCQSCHGPSGQRMEKTPITYKALTNPNRYLVPYEDSTIYRFLDEDLKSDGQKANIGVRWKMSEQDKKDLVAFLKTL